jgi:hypothetical protein
VALGLARWPSALRLLREKSELAAKRNASREVSPHIRRFLFRGVRVRVSTVEVLSGRSVDVAPEVLDGSDQVEVVLG